MDSYFFTVTVKSDPRNPKQRFPGQRDPSVAGVLYEGVQTVEESSAGGARLSNLRQGLGANWLSMRRGGLWSWYQDLKSTTNSADDKMAYVCDANLGRPTQVDCSSLQYSMFGSPSETITIGTDTPKTLSSGTCTVAISAGGSISLTWAQIIAAVGTLIEICVDNPIGSSQGGTAVAGTQSLLDLRPVNRKKKRRELGERDITGLNALPQGLKVTVSGPH